MVSLLNKFYRGVVHSPIDFKHPNFRFLLVDTVYEKQDEYGNWYLESFGHYDEYLSHHLNSGDIFYGVYGSYWIDIPKSGLKITETDSLQQAINIAEEIMGAKIIATPVPKRFRNND